MYDLRKLIAHFLNRIERQFSDRDQVGASGIFSRLQPRRPSLALKLVFYKPGWLLITGVTSLAILAHILPAQTTPPIHGYYLAVLIAVYLLYTYRLEVVSRRQPDVYDDHQFRRVRITINLLFASAVVAVTGGAHSYFWFVFLFPLLQGVTYFVEDLRSMFALTGLTLLCFFGFSLLGSATTVDLPLLFTNGAVLSFVTGLSYGLYRLARQTRSVQHFEALMAIQTRSFAVNTQPDLDETLLEIARQIVRPLDAQEVTIFRYDKERQLLHQLVSQSKTTSTQGSASHVFRLGQGIAGYVAKHREAYRCADTVYDRNFDPDSPRAHNIRSLLVAPIVADKQLLGVISVDSADPYHFDSNDEQLLLAFANYLANRLQRARLLDALHILGQSFDEAQEDAFGRILDELQRVIPYDSASLFLRYDDHLIVKDHRGYPNPEKVDKATIPLNDTLFQKMADNQKPLVVNNAQEDPHFHKYGDSAHIGSWLGVPLIIEGEVHGFLSVDKKQASYFGQSDIEFATIFAHHAALAITRTNYNQKLEEWLLETELYAEQLEAVNQFSTEVNVNPQLKTILSVTVQRVAEWFDVPRSAIALIEDGATHAHVIAHWPDRQGHGARIPLDSAVARHILRHKEPLAIDDAQRDPLLQDDGIAHIVHKNDIRSMLIVPILIHGEVAGTIGLDVVGQKRIFTRDEIEWAKRIALEAGLAINNARQRDQWHRRATRRSNYLRRALEASKKVAAVRRGDDALKAIARNLRRMFDYDSVILFPYLAADEMFEHPVIAGSVRHEEAVQSEIVSQSRVAQLIQHEEPYYFTDDSINDEYFKGPFVEREGIASSGFVRLTVADETLGLLFVNSCTPRTFSEEEIDAVSLFANLAALAIRNVRHYAQLQSEVGELEVLLATQHENGEPRSRMKQFEETAAALLKQGYDSVAIYPYDPFVRQFDTPILLGDVTHYEDTIGAVRLEGTVVGRRMTEGEEYYFTYSPQDADDLHAGEFVKREGICASASLRMRSNDRLFGLLFVNKKDPLVFSAQRQHLLALTAMSLAAVQREACERRYSTEQREHLEQIRRKVGNTLNLDEVRDEIYKGLWKMFGEDALPALLMYDETDKNLRLLYTDALASRVDVPSQRDREHLGLGEGLCGWVARERAAANVPDVRQDERYLRMHSATRSELAVPIIGRDDQLVGVLDVESPRLQRFSEEDERWLQSVASEVATAVWNAGQYRRRGQLLEAFQNSIRPIMSSPKRGPTLQAILAEAAELTGSHLATIQQKRGDRLCLEAVHPPDILDELRASIGDCLSMEDDTVTVKAARMRETQCVKDTSECENFLSSGLEERESGSEVAAPILNEDGTVWGVLNVEWRSTNAFDEEEVLALTSLANLASVALHTIRRTDELRRTSSVAAMGAWAAALAHDNNTKVAAIRRSVFLLEENADLPSEARPRLRQIDACAEELDVQVLLSSPPNPGESLPSEATAVVDDVLRAEAQRFQQAHEEVCLETSLACPELRANIHRRWLRQILQLLVNNALEAPGEAARQVTISSERLDGYVRISVQDNAAGIPEEYRDDLFERDIVKENGRVSRGALLVRTLIDFHGGRLEPIQTETGAGTTITFQLPLAVEAHAKERRMKEKNA